MKACAEKHVMEALHIQQRTQAVVPDEVASALAILTQAFEKCPGPNCNIPFEHTGDCNDNQKVYTLSCTAGGGAAMHCRSCKSHYCFWCRSIIKSVHTHINDSDEVHRHVFDCEKRPDLGQILTSSVLFPVGNSADDDTSDFFHAFNLTRKLETLAVQMKTGLCTCTPENTVILTRLLCSSRLVIRTMQAACAECTISRITCDFARNPNQVQSIASRKTKTFDVSFSQGESLCTLCTQCTLTNAL